MQIEPPKAEPPKRERRRFQFRLRTLLIGVTLAAIACWVIVDRQRLIAERDQARAAEAEAKKAEDIASHKAIVYAEHASESVLELRDEITELRSQLAKKK